MTATERDEKDPDVPRIQAMLADLQASVAKKQITPKAANQALGVYCDTLATSGRRRTEKNRLHGQRYGSAGRMASA